MKHPRSPLRLNIGFITRQSVGYSWVFPFGFSDIYLHPDLELDSLTGEAEVSHTPQGLLVQASLQATTQSDCARCLTRFSLHLETDFTELFALSEKHTSESGLILPENGHIDLEPIARECIILGIPISPICKNDCGGLCPICGENLNRTQCDHKLDDVDPRLEILKSLKPD